MTRYAFGIIAALLAGCSVEPAPLITIPQGHPGSPESAEVAYTPPPNPFKGDVPAATSPGARKEGHEGHAHHPPAQAAPQKDYPLDVCVVSGEKLGSMGKPAVITHEGREVRFCCAACIPKFKEDPARYLKKLDEAEKHRKPDEKKDAEKESPKKHEHGGHP